MRRALVPGILTLTTALAWAQSEDSLYVVTNRLPKLGEWTRDHDPTGATKVYEKVPTSHFGTSPNVFVERKEGLQLAFNRIYRTAKMRSDSHPTIIFSIHGFNTGAESAISRAWMVQRRLNDQGVPAVVVPVVWPDDNSALNYQQDKSDADASTAMLIDVFEQVRRIKRRAKDLKVGIVAHSLGNYALMEGARKFMASHRDVEEPLIDQAWLVSPDLSSDDLSDSRRGRDLIALCSSLSVYWHRQDYVHTLGLIYNNGDRMGRVGLAATHAKVDSVDCTRAFPLGLGNKSVHADCFTTPVFYEDLAATLGVGSTTRTRRALNLNRREFELARIEGSEK